MPDDLIAGAQTVAFRASRLQQKSHLSQRLNATARPSVGIPDSIVMIPAVSVPAHHRFLCEQIYFYH